MKNNDKVILTKESLEDFKQYSKIHKDIKSESIILQIELRQKEKKPFSDLIDNYFKEKYKYFYINKMYKKDFNNLICFNKNSNQLFNSKQNIYKENIKFNEILTQEKISFKTKLKKEEYEDSKIKISENFNRLAKTSCLTYEIISLVGNLINFNLISYRNITESHFRYHIVLDNTESIETLIYALNCFKTSKGLDNALKTINNTRIPILDKNNKRYNSFPFLIDTYSKDCISFSIHRCFLEPYIFMEKKDIDKYYYSPLFFYRKLSDYNNSLPKDKKELKDYNKLNRTKQKYHSEKSDRLKEVYITYHKLNCIKNFSYKYLTNKNISRFYDLIDILPEKSKFFRYQNGLAIKQLNDRHIENSLNKTIHFINNSLKTDINNEKIVKIKNVEIIGNKAKIVYSSNLEIDTIKTIN